MKQLKNNLYALGLALLMPLSLCAALSDQSTKDRMKSDLDIIRNTFDVCYAPKEWKLSYSGWSLDEEIKKAKDKIQNISPMTTKAYQRIVRDFFNSMKDYHVNVRFWSTEHAHLPFLVKEVSGKYFITYVDWEKLSSTAFPLFEGDELVLFDGRPVAEVFKELLNNEMRSSNEETDRGLASLYLTNRFGSLGHMVPKGPIMIGVKSSFSDKVTTYQLIWEYEPEKITNHFKGAVAAKSQEKKEGEEEQKFKSKLLQKQMLSPNHEFFKELSEKFKGSKDLIGSRESVVPTLGKIWWESDPYSFYKAYLYETDDRKMVGYIRIPHFIGFEWQTDEFADVINFFQERSDAMVIDQINNPGGFVFLCYGLASMLTDQPLHTPKHRMTITQEDVAQALEEIEFFEGIENDEQARAVLGDSFFGIPVTYQMVQFVLDYLNFVIDEWNAGRHLTEPYYLLSIDKINPHPSARYTKPILLLINNLDFSGGDFFPAILQDNKRVKLFGTRTAGAGGYVLATGFPNLFGINYFTYTGSIAERMDKSPIENLGVTPDIHYSITEEDIKSNYQDYKNAINKAVQSLLTKEEETKRELKSELFPAPEL